MPEQTHAPQQQMLAQQAFVLIRQLMSRYIT